MSGGESGEGNSREGLELGLSLGIGENAKPFEPIHDGVFSNVVDDYGSSCSGSAAGGSLGKLQFLVGGCSRVMERETAEEQDLRIKRAKASNDVQ